VATTLSETVSSRAFEIDVDGICCDTELCCEIVSTWVAGDLGAADIATLSSCDVEDFVVAGVALETVPTCGRGDFGRAGVALPTVSACGRGDCGGVGIALSTGGDLEGINVALSIFWLELDACSSHNIGSILLGVGTDLVFMVDVAVAGTAPLLSPLVGTGKDFKAGALLFPSLTVTKDCTGPFRTLGVFSKESDEDEPAAASAAAFFSKWALSSSLPSISF